MYINDCNLGIPAVLANPGIGGISIVGFWDYKKLAKMVLFRELGRKITILSIS